MFVGYYSGYNNTTGSSNQFSGSNSGYANTTGNDNLFSGFQSGQANTTGFHNLFSGSQSGQANTTGANNLFSGTQSGYNNTTGGNNTALGYNSGPGLGNGALTNTTALGNAASVTTSNTIQLGNAAITALRCQVALTVTSDSRFKYNVRADVPGLAFIQRLRPVTYRLDGAKLAAFQQTGTLRAGFAHDSTAVLHTGFLAQEVEQAAQGLRYPFDGVHVPTNARDYYGLSYSQFVVPLVQAVQEQQVQIEALKAQNAALQGRAAQADADHASLLTLQQQMARLLGEAAPAGAQARK